VHHVDPGPLFEQLAGEVLAGAGARVREGKLARMGFRMRDQLGHGLDGQRGMHRHRDRLRGHLRDGREIALDLEGQALYDQMQRGHRVCRKEDRVAVGR
jgi:hypothetical protein